MRGGLGIDCSLLVVAQFEFVRLLEGSPTVRRMRVGDPSLPLKSGSAQDDATKDIQTEPLPHNSLDFNPQT
jgi:hypothetical protein